MIHSWEILQKLNKIVLCVMLPYLWGQRCAVACLLSPGYQSLLAPPCHSHTSPAARSWCSLRNSATQAVHWWGPTQTSSPRSPNCYRDTVVVNSLCTIMLNVKVSQANIWTSVKRYEVTMRLEVTCYESKSKYSLCCICCKSPETLTLRLAPQICPQSHIFIS